MHNIENYHQINRNTIAIVFLGSPHRGMDVDKLFKSIHGPGFLEANYFKDLSPNSQCIKEINNTFGEFLGEVRIASFWESTDIQPSGVCYGDLLTLTFNSLMCLRFQQR